MFKMLPAISNTLHWLVAPDAPGPVQDKVLLQMQLLFYKNITLLSVVCIYKLYEFTNLYSSNINLYS